MLRTHANQGRAEPVIWNVTHAEKPFMKYKGTAPSDFVSSQSCKQLVQLPVVKLTGADQMSLKAGQRWPVDPADDIALEAACQTAAVQMATPEEHGVAVSK